MNSRIDVLIQLFEQLGITIHRHPRLDIAPALNQLQSQYPEQMDPIVQYLQTKKDPNNRGH